MSHYYILLLCLTYLWLVIYCIVHQQIQCCIYKINGRLFAFGNESKGLTLLYPLYQSLFELIYPGEYHKQWLPLFSGDVITN